MTTKERPILFSGPMVRAILEDRKTQTRRVVKPQPVKIRGGYEWRSHNVTWNWPGGVHTCSYGKVGDRFWVRESHQIAESLVVVRGVECWYPADDSAKDCTLSEAEFAKFRMRKEPYAQLGGRFMYRSLCRIVLEITGMRAERLNEITDTDAIAEGCEGEGVGEAKMNFSILWESINGVGSWAKNHWVWVVEFKRVEVKRGE